MIAAALPGLTLLLAVTAAAADGGTPEAPAGLRCLSEWYEGAPSYSLDAGWGWQLPDGAIFIPWDDGVALPSADSDADDAQTPTYDLHEVFAVPYVAGPIVPIIGSGAIEDPGRARVEQLFLATYGASAKEVREQLGRIWFFGTRYAFHRRAVPALERVVKRLEDAAKQDRSLLPFFRTIGGTFAWRRIARSKNLSTHAWGIAIDLNVARSTYWRWAQPREPIRWRNKMPQTIVDAFEAEGFIWGGRWLHYDTMHFEYRPELLAPACRESAVTAR